MILRNLQSKIVNVIRVNYDIRYRDKTLPLCQPFLKIFILYPLLTRLLIWFVSIRRDTDSFLLVDFSMVGTGLYLVPVVGSSTGKT